MLILKKLLHFNLTSNKFNIVRETDAINELKKQYES